MKRLVYSPKVHAYVKADSGIIDLSPYIVSGQVTRKINQVSSAALTIRNPDFRFTYDTQRKKSTGEVYPVLHPMDPIFITMNRYSNREILVFTGYLDETPYIQLYPGTCDLTASCTLKRLNHTWYDPALPYTLAYMQSKGWFASGNGSLVNIKVERGNTDEGDRDLTDSSFASLLFSTLKDIGNWDASQIYVQPLPPQIKDVGTKLYTQILAENAKTATEVQELFSNIIGSGPYGSGGSIPATGGGPGGEESGTGNSQTITGSNFSKNAKIFAETLSSLSGINLQAIGAWMIAENPVGKDSTAGGRAGVANDQNWLNAGKTDTHNTAETRRGGYGKPASAAALTWAFLQNGNYDNNILKARGQGPNAAIVGIVKSPWASSRYSDGGRSGIDRLTEFLGQVKVSDRSPQRQNKASTPADPGAASTVTRAATRAAPNSSSSNSSSSSTGSRSLPRNPKNSGGDGGFREGANSDINENVMDLANQLFKLGYFCTSGRRNKRNGSFHNRGLAIDFGDATNDMKSLTKIMYPLRSQLAELWIPTGHGLPEEGFYNLGVKGGIDAPTHIHIALDPGKKIDLGTGTSSSSAVEQVNAVPAPQPKVDYTNILKTSPKFANKPKLIVLHSTEGNNQSGVTDLAILATAVFAQSGDSVHIATDAEGRSGRYVADDVSAGHVLSYNGVALGIEQIGHAAQKSWPDKQYNATAAWVAYWSDKFDIPLVRGEVASGGPTGTTVTKPGVLYHSDLGSAGGGHTDPGSGYDFGKVIDIAKTLVKGGNSGNPGTSPGGVQGTDGSGTATLEEVKSIARSAAFSAYLEGPTLADTSRSLFLKGRKSLMNDKPLMPFIEEICSASQRQFMSLPNGDFFAFYPDYFGVMGRVPYWEIDDVEILDGKIQLSDAALATHVYVVGDIRSGMDGTPNGIDWVDEIASAGVITIFDAFNADFIGGTAFIDKNNASDKEVDEQLKKLKIRPEEKRGYNVDKSGKEFHLSNIENAVKFVQRYGLRPVYVPAPMIRNPLYEMFAAYQKFQLLWSQQFLTNFSFTFMPELYPGGLVALPKHGISLYVEEVMHTFDYTGGFQTQAQLSSPSALGDGDEENRRVSQGMIRPFGDASDSNTPVVTGITKQP